jgi:hypothetical protein
MKNLVFYVHVSHLAAYKHGTSEKMNVGHNAQFWWCVAHTNSIVVIQETAIFASFAALNEGGDFQFLWCNCSPTIQNSLNIGNDLVRCKF